MIVQMMVKSSANLGNEDYLSDEETETGSESGESLQLDDESLQSEEEEESSQLDDESLQSDEELVSGIEEEISSDSGSDYEDSESDENDSSDNDDNSDENDSEYSDLESEISLRRVTITQEESHAQVNYNFFYRRINEFYVADKYTDVKIKCQNQSFKCHRLVLAAASEYFDTMFYGGFNESHKEEINLENIDVITFGEVLKFAYLGEVTINDENVYNLLCVSDMLGLNFIEKRCVCYLIERTLPTDYAFDIFAFVLLRQKKELIPTVTQFMLDHLEHFFKSNELLKIPFDDLTTWLTNCPPLSSRKEKILLDTIYRWVSHSTLKDKKTSFTKLTQCVKFDHLSEEQIIEYFAKNEVSENTLDIADSTNLTTFIAESFLHAFVNSRKDDSKRTNIFTLQTHDDDLDWRLSHIVNPAARAMRTVAFDDRLFALRLIGNEHSFCSRSSIDLSAPTQTLKLPEHRRISARHVRLCCDKNRVYVCRSAGFPLKDLDVYNPELDLWSSIEYPSEKLKLPTITCDDSRVYLIGGANSTLRNFSAYDYRTKNWEELPNCKLGHEFRDECCFHKGKIYVSCRVAGRYKILEMYDPVAGRWDSCKEMKYASFEEEPVRLLSYGNHLYLFNFLQKSLNVQMYDSFLQKWSSSSSLQSAMDKKFCSNWNLLDVVIFNH